MLSTEPVHEFPYHWSISMGLCENRLPHSILWLITLCSAYKYSHSGYTNNFQTHPLHVPDSILLFFPTGLCISMWVAKDCYFTILLSQWYLHYNPIIIIGILWYTIMANWAYWYTNVYTATKVHKKRICSISFLLSQPC